MDDDFDLLAPEEEPEQQGRQRTLSVPIPLSSAELEQKYAFTGHQEIHEMPTEYEDQATGISEWLIGIGQIGKDAEIKILREVTA